MQTALAGVPESAQERPSGLTPLTIVDPAGRTVHDHIYSEFLVGEEDPDNPPPLPPAQQAPAPVRDAQTKPVER